MWCSIISCLNAGRMRGCMKGGDRDTSLYICLPNFNYNNNNQDDIYGAVIMAKPLQEFTRFIW